jgi:hypothetical protein
VGLNPTKDDGFLRVIKIRNTNSFQGEVKPLDSCRKFYDMLKIPAEYDRDTSPVKFKDISRQLLASLLGVSAVICDRALVDESGMIRTQLGMHIGSENGWSAWDALYDTSP